MPSSAEKSVKTCIQKIKDTFEGFDEAVVEEFYNILLPEVKAFGEEVRREAMSAVARGVSAEPEKPSLKRVSNYTLFGTDFRASHTEIKAADMFNKIAEAWKALSADQKAEWKSKADAANAAEKERYVKEHGEPPKKKKAAQKQKRTHAFRVFTAEFRTKNPKVDHKEVFAKASAEFKKLTPKQKEKYEAEATKLNEQFKLEHEKYVAEHPEETVVAAGKAGAKVKKERLPAPSKRSGYLLFGNEWREKLNKGGLKGKEAMVAIGTAWKALAEKERTKFNSRADKENEKIVAEFVKSNPDSEWAKKHKSEEKVATA
jgi:hypothetical protein